MQFSKITNKQVKFIQSLKQKKFRQKYNKYTIEGLKIVQELATDQAKFIDFCVTTQAFLDKNPQLMDSLNCSFLVANSKQMEMMSQMKTAASIMAVGSVDESLTIGAFAQKGRYLFLEQAQDPGNMGTMIRTAAWFGMDGVLIGEGSTELWNQKVIQSSMGAVFKIQHKIVSIDDLKSSGIPVISTALDGEDLANFDWPDSYILCLGNEGKGITDELKALADKNIFIESFNNKGAESLNVASSAAILMYSAHFSRS